MKSKKQRPPRLLSSADAKPSRGVQHTSPCSDCPWARASLPGWLGSMTADEWLAAAHGEAKIDCHTLRGAQCAGSAIYRANVFKMPRDPSILMLPADEVKVFGFHEFKAHHEGKK